MKLFQHTYKTKTDEELMRAIQSGEVRAFDVLYDRYATRMVNYFYHRLGYNKDVAQDMLQNLFMKIIEKPHLFHTEKKFSSWIYAVASNMCKNEYRRQDLRQIEQPLEPDNAADFINKVKKPDEKFDHKEFGQAVQTQLNHMDEIKRETFLLRFQHQLSIKEISEVLNCSEGTVKSRLFYTIRALAEALPDFHPNTR
jgi:RNA polymerase sigma-70 factor (ECF subfamily)